MTTLTTRLAISYATLALLVAGVITLGLTRAATTHLQEATGGRLQELAYEMTDRLDRGMFERHQDIQILAKLDLLRDHSTPNHQRQALVEELQKTFTPYAWIGYAAPDGEVLASTGGLLEGANVAQREWFQRATLSAFVGDVHDAVLLAKLLPKEGNEPLRFVDVSSPIRNTRGELIGVLGAHLSWNWARDVQQALLQPLRDREDIDVLVLAKDHTVLLGPPELQGKVLELNVMQRDGLLSHAVERWPDGHTYVTGLSVSQGHRDYPGLGWKVVTRQDTRDAFAVIHAFQRNAVLAALLVTLAFGLIGAWRAHVITRPLARLTRSAQQINDGALNVEIPESGGYREATQLSKALRSLVNTLEAKVDERTRALQASTERANALSDLSRVSALDLLPEEMAARAAVILASLCRFEWVGLATATEAGAEHRSVYVRPGIPELTEALPVVPRGRGIIWAALERHEALFIDDYPAQVQAVPQFVAWGANGAAFLPVNAHTTEPHVLIFARHAPEPWTTEERTLLSAAAGVLGIAFERRAHEEYLARAALEDQLTGLRNRRAFDLDLEAALVGAKRHEHPVAVMMIDLDGLKQLNDAEGHERGDALLGEFARNLEVTFRGNDRAYRLGGDEYALLLSHAGQENVGALLRRVRKAEELTRAAGFSTMGASTGVAFFPAEALLPGELVRLADERMYEEKADRKLQRSP